MNETKDIKYYVHDKGMCDAEVGDNTRVWAFAHVMNGAVVGNNCNIGEHCFVESGAVIGNNCTIKNGVAVWEGVVLETDVFVGPYACFTNDLVPRTKSINSHYEETGTLVKRGASIGANATIVCGVSLGEFCMVGAGSVVTSNIPAFCLVYGNPARNRGWVSIKGKKLIFNEHSIATDEDGNKYYLHENAVTLLND